MKSIPVVAVAILCAVGLGCGGEGDAIGEALTTPTAP